MYPRWAQPSRRLGRREPLQRRRAGYWRGQPNGAPRGNGAAEPGAHGCTSTAARRDCRRTFRAQCDRAGVDVAREHAAAQRLRRGDREHAGAGADIEDTPRPSPLTIRVEREQAAAGGAVMAGAEGERRLDLDADAVRRTRARSCAPCTTKRPASTGLRPSRLLRTQSVGASVSNANARAASAPAADSTRARTAASSGRSRKCTASDQRPSGSSNAEAATCSPSKVSASASPILRAAAWSVERRATAVGEGSGIAQFFPFIPDIHRRLSTVWGRQFTGQSTPCPVVIETIVHRFAGCSSSSCSARCPQGLCPLSTSVCGYNSNIFIDYVTKLM